MAATWQRLGDAAGAKGIGLNRVRVDPGRLSTPPHSHGLSEEIFYVLGGSGLSWQDERVCEVRAGDTIVHLADHEEHTLRAGPDGLDYLVFGTRHPVEAAWLPRSRAIRLGWPWTEGRDDDPWDVEAEIGELEFAEPRRAAAERGRVRRPPARRGRRQGARRGCGLRAVGPELDPTARRASAARSRTATRRSRRRSSCSRAAGPSSSGRRPLAAERGAVPESHELRPGHVVARPPGTRIAHSIVAGPEGLTYLAYGTREPNDICLLPALEQGLLPRRRVD